MTATPPRPLAPGDIVTAFSEHLGEWTAAQVTRLSPESELAVVLELAWSGPEPATVAELGEVEPLRLTHHSWNGTLAHTNWEWVLPRSYRVLGSLPLLGPEVTNSYSSGWYLGHQLHLQRRWDAQITEEPVTPWAAEYTGAEIGRAEPDPGVRWLTVRGVEELDCAPLVTKFPHLQHLTLRGRLGLLRNAVALNELTGLRRLAVWELFGMTAADCLLPHRVPEIEAISLDGIPAEYAAATRKKWKPEIPQGVHLDIRGARKPEWVAENRDNPLRNWDGRQGIGPARYKKAIAQYKQTRRAVLAVLADPAADRPAQLAEIGREYGELFNRLDGRSPFIGAVEREELFEALTAIAPDQPAVATALAAGVDAVRDW
ncbi:MULTISPECIES: hypothetical protein [unclassified Crossiella]|uniref:hypothetical protein n=1 Tax=unclassified Crossiella TaxID=2620835 RepID=UPI0020004615|nr:MULTISPECIES: hypothetical protein [unclassified Crossiella]MCK2242106.1 hypothetical protein [Crossiella sp. S99.2]MCK2256009.1 hypothetical protein [Crossiella sp. S99.1]